MILERSDNELPEIQEGMLLTAVTWMLDQMQLPRQVEA